MKKRIKYLFVFYGKTKENDTGMKDIHQQFMRALSAPCLINKSSLKKLSE